MYEFEEFLFDPVRRLLTRQGEPVPLPPKALATLLVLVERRGQVVEKEELLQTVWPDTFVTEATLTQNIFRLRKALGEEAGEHRFIVTVPGRGYSFVADLRRTVPSSPQTAPAPDPPPVAETAAEVAVAPLPPFPEGPSLLRRWTLYGGSTLGVIGLAATLLVMLPPFRQPDSPPGREAVRDAAPAPRRSIAVLGFRNLSGRPQTAWLSTALAEMFTVELGVGEKLHTITGESVTRTQPDLGPSDPENLSSEALTRLRSLLGCDVVLLGSYLALGAEGEGRIRIDLRLQDTASGETLAVLTATRTEAELFELVSDLGRDLRQKLGSEPASRTEVGSARAAFPVHSEAARLYAEGLEHLRALDAFTARDLLVRATRAEPDFPLAHAALASAWSTLGDDGQAEQEAARALELSATLPREDRILVEALHAETRKEWSKAVDLYESLRRFFPDDLEHGLRLARAEVAAGLPQRALLTISTLRKLPAPSANDPRLDLAEAEATAALSDYARQESAAAEAAEKGQALGARLLTAQALLLRGQALRSLGRQEEALDALDEALERFHAVGHIVGEVGVRTNLAGIFLDLGRLQEARTEAETALRLSRQVRSTRRLGSALQQVGLVLLEDGRLDEAQAAFREMEDLARQTSHKLLLADAEAGQAQVQRLRGKLPGAVQKANAALGLWTEAADRRQGAAGRLALARLALDEGRIGDAEREARNAVEQFRALRLADGEALSREALAGVFLARAEATAASREVRRALELTAASRNLRARLTIAITAGRVAAVLGKAAEARRELTTARDEAALLGLRLIALEASFALAELELRRGDPSAGRSALRSLQQEAARQGFLLAAVRARDLLGEAAVAQRR